MEKEISAVREIIHRETPPETIDREGPRLMLELVQAVSREIRRRESATAPSVAMQIRQTVDLIPNGSISLDQLAQKFHVSKQHLIRLFKQEYGITPYEYVLNRRVGLAQSLLKKTGLSVREIAEQLNFCDGAYFTEFFRKHTGMTPLQFRKEYGPSGTKQEP